MKRLTIAELQRALDLSEGQALILADVVGKVRQRAPLRRSDADVLLTQLERACERILGGEARPSTSETPGAPEDARRIPHGMSRDGEAWHVMKARERRLHGELRILADGAGAVFDRRALLGIWCRRFAIAPDTAEVGP